MSEITHNVPKAQYVLRSADIREMVKDGSIEKQHFLIRILAEKIVGENPCKQR